jgi:hypothetical protein
MVLTSELARAQPGQVQTISPAASSTAPAAAATCTGANTSRHAARPNMTESGGASSGNARAMSPKQAGKAVADAAVPLPIRAPETAVSLIFYSSNAIRKDSFRSFFHLKWCCLTIPPHDGDKLRDRGFRESGG